MAKETASSSSEPENNDELEQITIARALLNYRRKEKLTMSNSEVPNPFTRKFPIQNPRPTSPQPPPSTTSKILPLICPKTASRHRPTSPAANDKYFLSQQLSAAEGRGSRLQRFPAAGAAPYVPIRQYRSSCHGIAPPVTIRTAVPCFSAPPLPQQSVLPPQMMRVPPVRIAPPVTIRQAVPVFAAPVRKDDSTTLRKEDPLTTTAVILKEESQTPAVPMISKADSLTLPSPAVSSPVIQKEERPIFTATFPTLKERKEEDVAVRTVLDLVDETISHVEEREMMAAINKVEETEEAAQRLGQVKI